MPVYCYRLPDGRIVERVRKVADRNKPLQIDGKKAIRCINAEKPAVIGTSRTWSGPFESLSVHPRQVPELNRLLMRRGCRPARFDKFGTCYPDDRRHLNEIMRVRGMCDLDAGYGDRAPGTGLAYCVEDNI